MKKKFLLSIFIILLLTISVGCGNNKNKNLKVIKCKISSSTKEDMDVSRSYNIYYKGNSVKRTESVDKIVTNDRDLIKKYSEAYQKIASLYSNVDHYDFTVKTTNNSVTSRIEVDYDKVDVDKIIAIEGEDDNIFKDKKVYLDNLLSWAKEHGIDCES